MLCLATSLSFAAMATQAEAQTTEAASSADSGEIIVTAQRRGESLQQVPISISALTQATMDRQGVRDIEDVVRLTPGLNFNRGGANQLTNISIRGIQSNGGASTTGIYLDDVAIQARRIGYGGGSPFLQVFDLERVEVLRGPQGTLFGAGSQGGTIRYITPQPSLTTFSAYGRAELSSTRYGEESYELGAAVGGPIVEDKLGFRVSGWFRRDGGWIDRVNYRNNTVIDKNSNDSDALVLRAALTLEPVEGVRITPSIYYQRERADDVSSYWSILSNPENGEFRNGNVIASPRKDEFYIPSLNVAIDVSSSISLVSVTSYLHRNQNIISDYTSQQRAILFRDPFPPLGAASASAFDNSQRTWAQELRLQSNNASQRFRWVIGAYYQRAKQSSTQNIPDPTLDDEFLARNGIPLSVAFGGQGLASGDRVYFQDPYLGIDEQFSGFGQADFDLTERLTVTAGLRVARTKFDVTTTVGGPFGGVGFTDSGSQSETPLTPKVGLQYRIDENSNLYASVAKGYRVGGYNPRQLSICQAQLATLGLAGFNPTTYDSDTVWSYEVGSKNQFFDRRLTVNGSLFFIKWNNIQQFVTLNSCGGGFLANLGTAESKGFDLQASLRVTDGLTLGASAGYTHGEFKDTVYAGPAIPGRSAVSSGDRLQGNPWRVAVNAEYRVQMGADDEIYLRGDYQYASAEPSNVPQTNAANGLNFVPTYYGTPATHFVIARAGVTFGKLDVSAFVDNLLDSSKSLERINQNNTVLVRYSTFRPRTIGLTATVRY